MTTPSHVGPVPPAAGGLTHRRFSRIDQSTAEAGIRGHVLGIKPAAHAASGTGPTSLTYLTAVASFRVIGGVVALRTPNMIDGLAIPGSKKLAFLLRQRQPIARLIVAKVRDSSAGVELHPTEFQIFGRGGCTRLNR